MVQNRLNKLELTWIGKYDEKPALEPRILIENSEYSYGNVETDVLPTGKTWKLIHGDNLLEQDEVGAKKETMLGKKIEQKKLFTIKWRVI